MTTATLISQKVPANPGPRIRVAGFADYPQISSLESRYGLNTKSYEEWAYLWTGNPVYREVPDWTIGWVLESESGEIVGHIANVPSACEFRGRKLLVASGRGLVVDERYRSYAFPLFSQFFNYRLPDLILNTTVNANGLKLHELFRCQRVPAGKWNEAVFWITDHSGFSSKLAAMKGLPAILGQPMSAALFVRDSFTRKPASRLPKGCELQERSSFDDGFSEFWGELKGQQAENLLSTRSRGTLDWHFKQALQAGDAWLFTITRKSTVLAYAVFLRQDSTELGLNRLRLVDFQSLDDSVDLLSPMLAAALSKCREHEIHMLEAIGFSGKTGRILASSAPHSRELPCWLYFYRAKDKDLAAALANPHVWNPTPYDGDGSL